VPILVLSNMTSLTDSFTIRHGLKLLYRPAVAANTLRLG
jgi:hypothetical protein